MSLVDTLRAIFLFERLSDEQLAWLDERGDEVHAAAGDVVFAQGTPADHFYTVLSGTLRLTTRAGGAEIVVATLNQPGQWAGYLPLLYINQRFTLRAVAPSRLFRVTADDFDAMLAGGFPIAPHLLAGLFAGTQNLQARLRQQEKLAALGRLAAGLAHELNNPASAVARSAEQLRGAIDRQAAAAHALGRAMPDGWEQLAGLRRELAAKAPPAPGAIERADREEAVAAWLDERGLEDAWAVAPDLVDASVDRACLEKVAGTVPAAALGHSLRWLAAAVEADRLLATVERGAGRISALVGAIKSYSYMDRAPVQDVDVREGLDSTLMILAHKLRDVAVERDYDDDLPRLTANGGELNQVWTNLIVNAVEAVNGRGRIRVGARHDGGEIVVDVSDTGPGIPADVMPHLFEPFFTTKAPGHGTGLGLEISYRIVTGHGGRIDVESRPGDTRFTVRLPLADAAQSATPAADVGTESTTGPD